METLSFIHLQWLGKVEEFKRNSPVPNSDQLVTKIWRIPVNYDWLQGYYFGGLDSFQLQPTPPMDSLPQNLLKEK